MKNKETYIKNLPDGSKIEIIGLEKCYKNLVINGITDCGAYVCGQMKDLDGIWKNINDNYVISATTIVRQIS